MPKLVATFRSFARQRRASSGLWSRDVDVEHVTKRLGQELHWSPKFHWWQKQYQIHLWRRNQRCYSLLGLAYQPPARQDYQSTSIPQAHTYLHFQSHHPIHHKSGVVRTLMDRKDTLVSTEDDKDRGELHIRNALKSCGYPKWIFDKVKHDQCQKRKKTIDTNKRNKSAQESKGLAVIPYVEGLSETAERRGPHVWEMIWLYATWMVSTR